MRIDPIVMAMATLRTLFGLMGFAAAALMLRYNDVRAALRINAVLGSIGPFVFLTVSILGIAGVAGQVKTARLIMTVAGVVLVLMGTR